jgi:hypothetical protein
MNGIESNFVPYQIALDMKSIGFDEPCFAKYYQQDGSDGFIQIGESEIEEAESAGNDITFECDAPLYQQIINFLYIYSDKQIDIELKGSDTYEERIRKIEQGCKDLWNLQNNKSK